MTIHHATHRPHRLRRALLLLLVLAAALLVVASPPSTARAQGVPQLDARDETVLVGPGVAAPSALHAGEWTVAEGRVSLTPLPDDSGRDQNYWIPDTDDAVVTDGFVRFRFDIGERLDSTVLFRASVSADDVAGLSGYGLSIERDVVQLYRWDDGMPLPMGESTRIKKLRSLKSVEGAIWFVGPHMVVQLYEGDSLDALASLVVSDHTYGQGRVGLRSYGKQDADSALTWLSVRQAGKKTGQRDSPIGNLRYVELADDALELIAAEDDARVVQSREGGQVLVEVTRRGLERMRRGGVPVGRVFEGPVYSFTDKDVSDARARGLETTDRGFVIDRSYKDPDMVEALLRGYHERYPELTELVELGRTHKGRPVLALKISDNAASAEDEPAVLLNGAHHGVELLSTEFVIDAIAVLLEDYEDDRQIRRLVDGLELWCVPLVNPDGNAIHMDEALYAGRKNGRDTNGNGKVDANDGVDLNRNYPFRWAALGEKGSSSSRRHRWYRGPRPGSEPETQAMMRLADSEHFASAISYHTWGTVILAPYTIDDVRNPEPNVPWAVAELMRDAAGAQANERDYRVKKQIYSVDGVDQDWFRFAHGTVALLVEGAYHNPESDRRIESVELNRPTWKALLERTLDGPGVYGHVTDADGNPVVADVRVAEIELKEGEVWTSRCRDGRFDRMLPGPGKYTLEIRVAGQDPITRSVSVGDGRKRVDIEVAAPPAGKLDEALCPDPAMCAADTLALVRAGRCVEPGAAQWCVIDGQVVEAGARDASGCMLCNPATLALEWSPRATGETCGAARCEDGQLRAASTCDGEGECVEGEVASCEPYAGCAESGLSCATGCRSTDDCTDGYTCEAGLCAKPIAADGAHEEARSSPSFGSQLVNTASAATPGAASDDDDDCTIVGVRRTNDGAPSPWWAAPGVLLGLAVLRRRS